MEDSIFEIVKLTLPALLVLAACYTLVKRFLDDEARKRMVDLRQSNQQIITPLRLQAYERLILLLERISPNNLVVRVTRPGIDAAVLQSELIKTIKAEYEHNLSQQIYVSSKAWDLVKNAKEEIIKLVNISASQLSSRSTGNELAQKIIELSGQVQKMPTQVAIDFVKKEISQQF